MSFLSTLELKLRRVLADKPVWFIILVNIYPIAGVILFQWDYFYIVLLYIIETVIIGLYNVAKMIKAQGSGHKQTGAAASLNNLGNSTSNSNPGCIKLFLIPFFLVHYNLFVIVQAVFVIVISVEVDNRDVMLSQFTSLAFLLSILILFLSHGYSFYKNYIKKGEYLQVTAPDLMLQPYKRIVIQQVTVIFGTFLILATNASVFFLVLLIILKTIFDIRAHLKVHNAFSQFS